MRGLFCMGQNPAVGGQNASWCARALAKLDWLVVRDLFETETAAFWKDAPEVRRRRDLAVRDRDRGLPDAGRRHAREGRLVHQHHAAGAVARQGRRAARRRPLRGPLRLPPRAPPQELYADSPLDRDRPIQSLTWDYPTHGPLGEPDVEAVLAEINGYTVADGKPVRSYQDLRDDGSTACGCWIYSGIMPEPGRNRAREPPMRRSTRAAARLGLRLAEQRPGPLQPRLGRPGRPPLVRAQAVRLVGRRSGALDRPRHARLPADQSRPTISRPPTPRASTRHSGDRSRS